MGHLDMLLTGSEPGSRLHHLHVVAAPADAVGPFGFPSEAQLQSAVYAIVLMADVDVEQFVAKTIVGAGVDHVKRGEVILFAALSQEFWFVEAGDEQARRLRAEGRLSEHPDMAEVTVVYGACRDGRRWCGRRYLTGPKAGTTEDVVLLVGRPDRRESEGVGAAAALVRRLVGQLV